MTPRRILVVEDDAAIRQGLVDALRFAGHEVIEASDGADGMTRALRASYDLLLLDLILPGHNGFDILEAVHQARPTMPVIVLTARGAESDRVRGLRMGADDYVLKPFSVRELLARIDAVLRRSPERPNELERIPLADGHADLARSEIRFDDGTRVELSACEVELLRYLASNPTRAISRQEILRRVWRLDPKGIETRTIDMHIAHLRDKLRDPPDAPKLILTVRGKGYAFAPAASASP
jgi:DNA-binding response OmpR family regulator